MNFDLHVNVCGVSFVVETRIIPKRRRRGQNACAAYEYVTIYWHSINEIYKNK